MKAPHNPNNPDLRSFVAVDPDSHFPIQNLPYGVFQRKNSTTAGHVGVAIGDQILDLTVLEQKGLLTTGDSPLFAQPALNDLLAAGKSQWTSIRGQISQLLLKENPTLRDNEALRNEALVPMDQCQMLMPVNIGDYTDFYSSKEHATNVGTMFRGKDNALMPNWTWIPVGYHGRASSVVISGTPIRRPSGQTKADDADRPTFGPCRLLDFELEMGFFTGPGNDLGEPITMDSAAERIFGMVVVNDWSARDIQKWEYVPLGPFLAKNFATSISPWVVTMDALEPFRCAGPKQDPAPLPYLTCQDDRNAYDIHLEVSLQSEAMDKPATICRSNYRHMYWNMLQQLVHHSVTGCNIRPGDLLASGTISGPTPDSYGSMLELTWRGSKPLQIAPGEERKFILDGDTVSMNGWCQGDGYKVGFGSVDGKIKNR